MPYRTPGKVKVVTRYEPTQEEVEYALREWLMNEKDAPFGFQDEVRFTWKDGNGDPLSAPPRPTISWDDGGK